MRRSLLAAAGLGSVVIALSGCGVMGGASASSANPGSAYGANAKSTAAATAAAAPMQSGTILTIKNTRLGYVLTNSKGDTLYWFSKDVRGVKSDCSGKCLTAWPAVTGKPVAGSGITFNGKLGFITRPGGQIQATYNGYPLYTFAEDMAPGQVNGNGVGGVWHVITGKVLTSMAGSKSTGSKSTGSKSSGSGSGSGSGGTGGYGY